MRTVVDPDNIVVIWIGEKAIGDTIYDMKISGSEDRERAVERVKAMLYEKGLLFGAGTGL